jgi:hypothetical protein
VPAIQTIQLPGLLETGHATTSMPFNAEVLKGTFVIQEVVLVSIQFDPTSQLQVERDFVLVANGETFEDDMTHVGTLKFADEKGVKFGHLLVSKQRSALSLAMGIQTKKKAAGGM